MPVNYAVGADIIDITVDTPRREDVFLVDSNVWYWMTYTRASLANNPPRPQQVHDYPTFINNAIGVSAKLYRCGLSFAELAHLIERTEREIFEKTHGTVTPKEYRHNHRSERSKNVVHEVKAAWAQVKTMALSLDVAITDGLADGALARFNNDCVDGYDLFFLEAMSQRSVVQIITDDGDFATVSGIRVFTANKNVIAAAKSQGRLITR